MAAQLWMSHCKIGTALELQNVPAAVEHWDKAHNVFASLNTAGELPDGERRVLDHTSAKLRTN
jgi:hypothetical protein